MKPGLSNCGREVVNINLVSKIVPSTDSLAAAAARSRQAVVVAARDKAALINGGNLNKLKRISAPLSPPSPPLSLTTCCSAGRAA